MGDYQKLGSGTEPPLPYFPPLYGMPECAVCEDRETCPNVWKSQRYLRDFTVTSGRCPRLPDKRGFVADNLMETYTNTFPLVRAEHETRKRKTGEAGKIQLTLYIPGGKDGKIVHYPEEFKKWWFEDDSAGETVHRFLRLENFMRTEQDVREYMEFRGPYACFFRCEIEDGFF